MNSKINDMVDKLSKSANLHTMPDDLINKNKLLSRTEMDSESAFSIISRQCNIKGDINSSQAIFIAGRFKGNIICNNTVVSLEGSQIDGRVEAQDIIIYGKCRGEIIAKNMVKLFPNCAVNSSIKGKTFIIEEGAVFDGEFSRV